MQSLTDFSWKKKNTGRSSLFYVNQLDKTLDGRLNRKENTGREILLKAYCYLRVKENQSGEHKPLYEVTVKQKINLSSGVQVKEQIG